mmetsp:Transcript_2600/g.4171  ORF Transcript_2600/g.4171 Transcript_2600/m.4171 type:complete len:164 (+) Transcript_2600:17-508(+)
MIETTLSRGITAWSNNQREICGAIYECTMWTIRKASGPAAGVQAVAVAATDMAAPYDVNVDENPAWIYRRGFDTILNAYDKLPPPPDSDYPASAGGTWAATAINSAGTVPMVNSTATSGAMAGSRAVTSAAHTYAHTYTQRGCSLISAVALGACVYVFALSVY